MPYRLTVALTTLIFATAAAGGTVYRWEDDSGRVHYGQQPPDGVEAEPVKPNVSKPASPSPGDSDAKGKQASAEDGNDTAGEVDEEFVREQCKNARQSVKNLKKHGPDARYANENDEIVTYSKEEYQQRLERAKRFKKRFCEDDDKDKGKGSQS